MDYSKIMNTYPPRPMTLTSGAGLRVRDDAGREYLDFTSGIGVTSIGHAHPKWIAAVSEQAAKLGHCSNLFYSEPGAALAERLAALSALDKATVFFANSGAEANEAAIKTARKYSADKYSPARHEIITLEGSFHGRTLTTLAATGQEKFHAHFRPLTGGFTHTPPNDIEALENNVTDNTCAIILEVIQGEGGVLPLDDVFVKAARRIADTNDLVLIIDEVQTGIGRTGKFFGYMHYGITPDLVSFAKGIAGGLPLGGIIAGGRFAEVLTPGTHATTYGMNPVVCAAALAVLEVLIDDGALSFVEAKGERLMSALSSLGLSARGKGLMIGAAPAQKLTAAEMVAALRCNGLLALTANTALRLLPALTVSDSEIDEAIGIIKITLSNI